LVLADVAAEDGAKHDPERLAAVFRELFRFQGETKLGVR
jgi:hypothetical protein